MSKLNDLCSKIPFLVNQFQPTAMHIVVDGHETPVTLLPSTFAPSISVGDGVGRLVHLPLLHSAV
jgi:hypothetical protein